METLIRQYMQRLRAMSTSADGLRLQGQFGARRRAVFNTETAILRRSPSLRKNVQPRPCGLVAAAVGSV